MPLGPIQTNCYLLYEEETKQCVIIDPGDEARRVINWINREKLQPLAILLTHTHFDHIGAVDEVRDEFSIPVYVHEREKKWLKEPNLNGSGKYADFPNVIVRPADVVLGPADTTLTIGPFSFDIYHTPGHSPGSITFHLKEQRIAFVGDVIFRQSIGRTDLIEGSMPQLLESIHRHILTMEEDTILYPGHGPLTSPGLEQDDNPFLHGF